MMNRDLFISLCGYVTRGMSFSSRYPMYDDVDIFHKEDPPTLPLDSYAADGAQNITGISSKTLVVKAQLKHRL